MSGTPTIPFSALFADTITKHGRSFGFDHYVCRKRMPVWEFQFWLRATGTQAAPMHA